MDVLQKPHDLPADILRSLDKLVVNRRGADPQSFMMTEQIVGHVVPGARYRLAADHLIPLVGRGVAPEPLSANGPPPPHVRLVGDWQRIEDVESADANILVFRS